jgi:acyl carrier protein
MSAPAGTIGRLRSIIAREFQVDPQLLQGDARLEDFAIDSLGLIEIMFAVEEEFGIAVPPAAPDTSKSIVTLDDLVRHIDRLVSEQHGATGPDEALS